ncbi:cytochrome P450 4V2 [Nephila pilipes]|uniref:Cytochrome P450 4V2 n=1 Tax=Nephila pilipes TaxID=299642 RepID=A0A8X6TQ42_NEPPI|nr:cytochrome P450 4V2 [Nephila pilipes]
MFGIVVLIVFVSAILLILKYALYRRKYSKIWPGYKTRFIDVLGNLSAFPFSAESRNGYPFNVFALQIIGGYCQLFRESPLFCVWASFVPFLFLKKAEAVEALIGGNKNMEKNWSYKWLHPWLGTGLLTSYGSKWKSRRKLLTPSFHFEILKDFLPIFNEQSRVLVRQLRNEVTKDSTDIVMPITLCSLDVICETTLGVAIGAQENRETQYIQSVSRAADIILERIVNPFYWIDFLYYLLPPGRELKHHLKVLHGFTRSVIQEKKKKLLSGEKNENEKRKRKALMDVLLEHHIQMKDLTEEDIREEVDTFAFEGHDTIATGMSWALYNIGLYKDVQEKIHEELDRIFGDDTERPVDTDDLKEMTYLHRVLKESQRLYPSVPAIARHVDEDTNICGYPVPKGSSCIILVYQLHRDETVFPNPEKFDPDRFLPENCADRHPYAYIPFSAGPRNCIGQRYAVMEEKVLISAILRNYTIESLCPRDKLPPAIEITLRSTKPILVRIRPRQRHTS